WDYRRHDDGPEILSDPGVAPYRYLCADQEVAFLATMIQCAIEGEIPREIDFLQGYERACREIDAEFDLPQKDISRLVRMIQGDVGRLSHNKCARFIAFSDKVVSRIELIVRRAFR
ncbi:MAG: hypothetical protein ACLFS2_04050, partial [Halochromatium sp.]|uniref:hypothetical protein n=1 Tax=Halochromatium sp. TaxID=2049430 RepID=UPI003979E38E